MSKAKEILKQYFGDYHDTAYDLALSGLRRLVMGMTIEKCPCGEEDCRDNELRRDILKAIADELFGTKG